MDRDNDLTPADHQHQPDSRPASRSTEPRSKRNWRLAYTMGISAILVIHPAPALLSPEHQNVTVLVDSTVIPGDFGPPLQSTTPPADTPDGQQAGG